MRKNVLILGYSYSAPFLQINNQYITLFHPNQYNVTVAYLKGKPCDNIRQTHLAKDIIFFNLPKKSIRGLKIAAIYKIFKLCRDKKFEIVITHRYKAAYIMMWVAKFHPISALFFVMHELGTIAHFSRKLSIALLAQKNMTFVGVSDAVRDDIRSHMWRIPKERIVTLHNTINASAIQSQLLDRYVAREKLHLSQNDFVFGTIGRLTKNKNQLSLIKAFSMIKKLHCPNAKLVIMGKGELESALKQQVDENHLSNDIILTGFLLDGFRYLKAFDVFVLSSAQEAFGLVLLEAMMAQVPIIATTVDGIPEVVGDTGILVPANNTSALTDALLTCYRWPEATLKEQGKLGYSRMMSHFSQERFNKIFWELEPIKNKNQ